MSFISASFSVCSSLSLLTLGMVASLYSFNSDCTVCSCSFNKLNSCNIRVSGWLDGLFSYLFFFFKFLLRGYYYHIFLIIILLYIISFI